MFGNLSHLIPAASTQSIGPPKDVPPPTPIHLPECRPRADNTNASGGSDSVSAETSSPPLTSILHNLLRPADQVDISHLERLNVHVIPDAVVADLVPDPACLPDFEQWDELSREQAHAVDAEPRPNLCNGRISPGASKYVELRQGLLTDNESAFRAVRRVAPRPGEQYVRLGYCHEFFRYLEAITAFWDDTSMTQPTKPTNENPSDNGTEAANKATENHSFSFCRTSAGTSMPAQYRTNLLTSFLKLVTYDFSCNIMSRQGPEPRLYIKSPVTTPSTTSSPRHSYFSSGCNFLFRMPQDRDTAKRGIIDGPIAAVSPRHTTLFPPRGKERESVIDLSREIIAALITAQNRAREGRTEERIGKDAWWATKRRWGGGPGGPVGKEEEMLELRDPSAVVLGDKDEKPGSSTVPVEGEGGPIANNSTVRMTGPFPSSGLPHPSKYRGRSINSGSPSFDGTSTQPPNPKRPRKSLAIYDAYRMVRPPAMHWDPKTRYTAIGRQRGVHHDDVFVISSLFHHVSILRVRVPDTLLAVLSGAVTDPGVHARGRLEIWRTRWFDLFVAQDRLDAMKTLWGVMAYAMREVVDPEAEGGIHGDGEAAKKDSSSR
ncbi:hypothetical protein N0V93_008778 [Gnomoniopsis smithogilvyi]|uniref:Uncharacterized protein n=1 Tax=Gnomoniopsis smithogilvyi TaxID=1191159 RepID=A0A9W9CU81_9PEZI|nr:hypothetical protein N0V93_008778 [Gnomoniopsis smithogilvyi]